MTDRVPAGRVARIMGAPRHATKHLAKAVSAERVVYILHSQECLTMFDDLRDCPFSLALDTGVDVAEWVENQPAEVAIEDGRLIPTAEAGETGS